MDGRQAPLRTLETMGSGRQSPLRTLESTFQPSNNMGATPQAQQIPQGNAGLPNTMYQPKYRAQTSLQENTNWLQGLPNLNSLFNPEQAVQERLNSLSFEDAGGSGADDGRASNYATSAESLLFGGFTPSTKVGINLGLASLFGNVVGVTAGLAAYNKERDAWITEQTDLFGYDPKDIEKLQSDIDSGVEIDPENPFSPQQQEADNPGSDGYELDPNDDEFGDDGTGAPGEYGGFGGYEGGNGNGGQGQDGGSDDNDSDPGAQGGDNDGSDSADNGW